MATLFILDSSALQTLNEIAANDPTLTEQLTDLRDQGRIIYCEAAKNERQNFAKGEPVTIWAGSGWRTLKSTAEVPFQSIQSVLARFSPVPSQQSIFDIDNEDPDQQQALVTVALALQLSSIREVVVVSNETFTAEDRCTVPEACRFLGLKLCPMNEFLRETTRAAVMRV